MLKAAIGFLTGIALAAGLWALVRTRDAGPRSDGSSPPGNAASPVPAANGETEESGASLQAIEAEIAKLESEAAALRALPAPAAAKPKLSLPELARRILAGFVEDSWIWELDDERAQALIGPFLEILRERALEKGVTLYEAAVGPDGVAALAMAVLAAMDPPPDAETMKRLEEARAALGKEFEEYLAKRDSLTRLEQYQQLERMNSRLESVAEERLAGTAQEMWWYAEEFWDQSKPSDFLSFFKVTGSRSTGFDDTCRQWTESWGDTLGLDANQKLALKPIVDEYARAIAGLNEDAEKRSTPEKRQYPNSNDKLALMIAAEKRIAAELGLNEKQVKALREWSVVPYHSWKSSR